MSAIRLLRRAAAALAVLAWLAGAALTAGWLVLRRGADPPEGARELAALAAPVEVLSDTFAIPHVRAEGELDAVRALGWLHADARMFQMDYFRRIAAGRLAEVLGEEALGADRFVRTLGLWRAAAAAVQALEPAERRRLRAYAHGVNARLRSGPRAPEMLLLGYEPEPWGPVASLGVAMVMNLDLSHWRRDLSRFRGRAILDSARLEALVPGYPEWGPTILDRPATPPPGARPTAPPDSPAEARGDVRTGGADPLDVLAPWTIRAASNAWAIAGDRTGSGDALLASDMHLALRAPSLWYAAALHADSAGLHVAGLTLPGVPGVVVGYNEGIAWGFTNGMVDDMDFAVETLSEDGLRYRDDGSWRPLEVRTERVPVRGREPDTLRIRSTRRGPLLSDALPGLDADLSAQWVAARVGAPTTGLAAMNRAREPREFDAAVRSFAHAHQNVVWAHVSGAIGYRLAGRIPLRPATRGAFPRPADSVGAGWPGFWDRADHPASIDPRRGYLASANQLQAPGLEGVLGVDYPAPFRALRLARVLEARRAWDPASTADLQRDVRSLLSDRTLALAEAAAEGAGRPEARALLQAWDRRVTLESRAAPLFYAWLFRLRGLVAVDEWEAAPRWAFFPMTGFLRVLERGDSDPWIDDVRTPPRETLAELSRRAMEEALALTGGRTWGELHAERHLHPLGGVRWLALPLRLNVGPYPSPGGPFTLRPDAYGRWMALDPRSWTPPWVSEYGPSERFVASLGEDGAEAWVLLPTGQSGHPFSAHYRDMNGRWRAGDPVAIPLGTERARARAVSRLQLVPAGD